MRIELNMFRTGAARQASPLGKLLPSRPQEQSPLESARQALLRAKDALEAQRDEEMEAALPGYRALRSRQSSYEEALAVQQENFSEFQNLNSRCDSLSEELSAARSEETQDLAWSRRVSALEGNLEAAEQARSAFLARANRCARGQAQYAAYLEESGQGGYAAYEYQGRGECTQENFAAETSELIQRLQTGSQQWRERVSDYCTQHGKTPYDFETYIQDRRAWGPLTLPPSSASRNCCRPMERRRREKPLSRRSRPGLTPWQSAALSNRCLTRRKKTTSKGEFF